MDPLGISDKAEDAAKSRLNATVAVTIALPVVTSLPQKQWLLAVAFVPTFFGVLMGLAGLPSWKIHPDAVTKLLSWL